MICENCKNGDHEHCLFDPIVANLCNCCTGKDYKMTLVDEAQAICGSDDGTEFDMLRT